MRSTGLLVLITGLLLTGPVVASPDVTADADAITVYHHARVFTANDAQPYAEALAVRGERIVAVGSLRQVLAAAGSQARQVDLQGRFLMPGLIDAHAHVVGSKKVLGGGLAMIMASYGNDTYAPDQLAAFVRATRVGGESRFGDVLIINGVNLVYWSHSAELDTLFSQGEFASVPLVLFGDDGHTAWANRIVRERAGVTAAWLRGLPSDQQAFYGHNAAFEPDGFVVDAGLTRLRQSLPDPDDATMARAARLGVSYMNAHGITAWLDAAVAGTVGGDIPLTPGDPGSLPAYRALMDHRQLTAHVAAYPVIMPSLGSAQLDVMQTLREQYQVMPDLMVPGIKVFADGVAEFPSQTAAMTRPYRNSGLYGKLAYDPDAFNQLILEADRRGLAVHVHAIGDRAVRTALDAFEYARLHHPGPHAPDVITHAQFVSPEDIPRFAATDTVAALQLHWAVLDASTTTELQPYLDPIIYGSMYPARALLETGAVLAGASDWPVDYPGSDSGSPFLHMAQAERRDGPGGVLQAEQRVPRQAMLLAYTRNAAKAIGMADQTGMLTPGRLADLVVLDRDIATATVDELTQTRVLCTIFRGQVVYGSLP
jgi:predicted amidohydrolase YtcJ